MHLFLSDNGIILPRWEQAFPNAVAVQIGAPVCELAASEALWLRLTINAPVLPQILAARQQMGRRPDIVLSDTPNDDEGLVVFSAGTYGYCNSHSTSEVLQQVGSVVLQGGLWVGESLMQRLVSLSAKVLVPPTAQPDITSLLTPRELEVALTVLQGASNKEIARQLGIADRTVKAHVSAIFEKLQVRDRLQLAMLMQKPLSLIRPPLPSS